MIKNDEINFRDRFNLESTYSLAVTDGVWGVDHILFILIAGNIFLGQ